MGIDSGFDMVPRLSKGAVDESRWRLFIEKIEELYQNDDRVEIKPNYIEFKAGEHPLLPIAGYKFLRFSSKVSGSLAEGVEGYIDTVALIAKTLFGSRIRKWNEAYDQYGFYDWKEIHESIKSYQKADELEIQISPTQTVSEIESNQNQHLFEILPVLGKGKGIVARSNIFKGERILCEKPLFTTLNLSLSSMMEENIATKLKALSKTEQRQFLSLHNNFPGNHPFSGIVRTNALPCGADSVTGGIYPTICRINHSCLPNAHNSWNGETNHEVIHATRLIRSGEEITISYDKGGPRESRRAHLKDAFGFDCSCSNCSLPPDTLEVSDVRRLQIQSLDDAIGDPGRVMSRPDECLADCYRLSQLLEDEFQGNPGASYARLCYDAFQISITHGDQARASVFAERGYQARLLYEGEDSPDTRKMKNLMKNPTSHRNFGASKRWKTAQKLVPKGLDADAFEGWLWRRSK